MSIDIKSWKNLAAELQDGDTFAFEQIVVDLPGLIEQAEILQNRLREGSNREAQLIIERDELLAGRKNMHKAKEAALIERNTLSAAVEQLVNGCNRVFDDSGWCPCCDTHRGERDNCLCMKLKEVLEGK